MEASKETGCQARDGPILCINNCGFFGSAATMNMCSKCHKEMILKQEQSKLAASSIENIVNGGNVCTSEKESVVSSAVDAQGDQAAPKFSFGQSSEVKAARGLPFSRSSEVKPAHGFSFGQSSEVKAAPGLSFGQSTEVKAAPGHSFGQSTEVKVAPGFSFGQSSELKAADIVVSVGQSKFPPGFFPSQISDVNPARAFTFGSDVKAKAGPSRCTTCRKRVGLTGFHCKCGNLFCGAHRYSDKHDCPFDYRTAARDAIAKANPVVKAEKLDKI